MKSLGLSTLVIALALPSIAAAEERSIDSVKAPPKETAQSAWTPAQQYTPRKGRGNSTPFGRNNPFGMLVWADEMGDKLSELGRFSVISYCFEHAEQDTRSTLLWAICGPDVKALDLKKAEQELVAENISAGSRKEVIEHMTWTLTEAKKIGELVEAAAKDDPGVAAVLKLSAAAKEEWSAYLAKNKETFDRFLKLKDAVRSGKSNHDGFAGCWEATRPAFEKLVRSTTFPWELPGSYLYGYMNVMLTSTASYITAASYGACAYGIDDTGGAIAAAALNQGTGGTIRVGWRTLAVAKALDPKLKPKFADRSLNFGEHGMLRTWLRGGYSINVASTRSIDGTPVQGTLASVKKDGDVTKIAFKGDTVEACLEWKDTVTGKVCKERGQVDNQENDAEVATKFAEGLAPGIDAMLYGGFPVVTWKGKKFVSVFGVTVKK